MATYSAPTHSHEEADKSDTATDCQVPLTDLRNRVRGTGNVENNNPQQADNHQGRENGRPPYGRKRNAIGPRVDLIIRLCFCTLLNARFVIALLA